LNQINIYCVFVLVSLEIFPRQKAVLNIFMSFRRATISRNKIPSQNRRTSMEL